MPSRISSTSLEIRFVTSPAPRRSKKATFCRRTACRYNLRFSFMKTRPYPLMRRLMRSPLKVQNQEPKKVVRNTPTPMYTKSKVDPAILLLNSSIVGITVRPGAPGCSAPKAFVKSPNTMTINGIAAPTISCSASNKHTSSNGQDRPSDHKQDFHPRRECQN